MYILNYVQKVNVLKFKTLMKFKIIEGVYSFPSKLKFVPDWLAISVSGWQQ
jgi:hypothetical protein